MGFVKKAGDNSMYGYSYDVLEKASRMKAYNLTPIYIANKLGYGDDCANFTRALRAYDQKKREGKL